MKIIKNTNEITEANTSYSTDGIKYFRIEYYIPLGYRITGILCGGSCDYVRNGQNVRYYRTLKRAIKAIKRLTHKREWGFGIKFKFEDVE